jgi:serine protease AprX
VIDTGVAPVPGLDGSGKVVTGPDLSLDAAEGAPVGLDAFGHGTFMASLIAGRDAGASASTTGCSTCLTSSGYSDVTKFVGVAPDARIVNVKVGAADGAADVTQVIAAIDWVTQHAHDDGFNIRVISLSFGTDTAQPYTLDPLAHAAEQAWKHGVVVVAAAGNDGKKSATMADPALDPFLIAVGARDPMGTLNPEDDQIADFAQHGTKDRPVDVTAPAVHTLGLRVPGSFIDTMDGNLGQVGARFQRGSGTSQAAAIVAGVAALAVQAHPESSPDQIKALLNGTALGMSNKTDVSSPQLVHWGHGLVDADAATTTPLPTPGEAVQAWTPSTGTGTLDGARGDSVLSTNGVALTGQQDIFGHSYDSAAMAAARSAGAAWTGGTWNGSRWTGDDWQGSRWSAITWDGTDWTGSRWSGSRWSSITWDGSRWSGCRWSGSRWSSADWTGSRWSDSTWT